ncbi:MAG: hypothetical protein U0572_13975 [Phycisphaerales bacterium]
MIAGLALLIAGILIPAQRELHDLRNEMRKVEGEELRMYSRLQAYDRFLSDLRQGDPNLIRRLAIAQLNLVPEGEESFLLTPGMNQTVAQWIDESVPAAKVVPDPYPDTLLGRLALGPNRLWLLGSAVFLLFVGLLFGPDGAKVAVIEPIDPVDGARSETTAENIAAATAVAGATSSADRLKSCVAGATFVAPTDEDAHARSVVDARLELPARQTLVVDEEAADVSDDDIIDVELVTTRAADEPTIVDAAPSVPVSEAAPTPVADAAPTAGESQGELFPEADAFSDRVIGSETDRIAPPQSGAD